MCEIKASEFWELTPLEILEIAEAKSKVIDQNIRLVAWQTANLMNCHTKRRITVDKLLGKNRKMMPHELREEIEKLRKLRKEGFGNARNIQHDS